MRRRIAFIMATACVLLITGCGASNSVDDSAGADSQMVENTDSTDIEENVVLENIDDAITSSETQESMKSIQSIFDELAQLEYRQYTCDGVPEYRLTAGDGITYYMNFSEKWVWRGNTEQAELPDEIILWLKANIDAVGMENTITFVGTIIENTTDTTDAVILVKPMGDEDEIPYDAVFFELPDGEEDWALKIDTAVLITCYDGFTESVPHFGTLISMIEMKARGMDNDALSPLDGVTMEVRAN